jgi:glycerophosphoryl diester phosphodiesterase
MAAFRLGLEQGADGIELDVHVSADGVPVVIHDATLERTTSGVGRVSEVSAALILDAVARGGGVRAESHVPALRDVLAWLPEDRGLVLDVKAVAAVEPTVELLAAARRASPGVTRLISFLPEAIELARALGPWLPTGLLLDEREDLIAGVAWARAGGHASVVPWERDLGVGADLARGVAAAHEAGLELGCYTVNDPDRAMDLWRDGVDFLMSDVPRVVATARRSAATRS